MSDKSTGDVDLEAVKKPISKEDEIGSLAVEVKKRERKGTKDGGYNSEKISEAQRSNKRTTEVDLEAVKEPISKESEIGSLAVIHGARRQSDDGKWDSSEAERSYRFKVRTFDLQEVGPGGGGSGGDGSGGGAGGGGGGPQGSRRQGEE